MDNYKKVLETDIKVTSDYFLKSINKNEQQKFLEELLKNENTEKPCAIADIACGGGTLSYHLSNIFANAKFTLIDYMDFSIQTAREVNKDKTNMDYAIGDIYALDCPDQTFDYTFCWQTLSWITNPELALANLIRITKPGGVIYASSLFNINSDVDVYSKVLDHTRDSSAQQIFLDYNTYSGKSISTWAGDMVSKIEFFEFNPQIDIEHKGRGLGTYTIETKERKRLQVSAGMLMNWYILKITV